MSTIEIKNLTKRFGSVQALQNVTLTFESGQIYGLLGRNGAGKTTLLNLITNKLFPDEGHVLVDGEPVQENDNALSKIYCMGEKNLFPTEMRISHAIYWTARFYQDFDLDYANHLAKLFGLDTRKKVGSLSTGYSSIFKIVLALASNAPILLLDEPVLGLDANHRDLFYRELIESYSKNPRTIVLSTHLIEEASTLIEQVAILKEGRLLMQESTQSLMSRGYCVSGPAGTVDAFVAGKQIIGTDRLGGLKSAYLFGQPPEQAPGLEFSWLDLQRLFIQLTNPEGGNLQ